jgi:hypothetical protein
MPMPLHRLPEALIASEHNRCCSVLFLIPLLVHNTTVLAQQAGRLMDTPVEASPVCRQPGLACALSRATEAVCRVGAALVCQVPCVAGSDALVACTVAVLTVRAVAKTHALFATTDAILNQGL